MPRRSRQELLLAANWQARESPWDWFVFALLTGLLLFMPLTFGAVEAWSELVVIAVSLGLLLLLAVRQVVDDNFRLARSRAYFALAAVLGFAVLQLLPLPVNLLGLLAPDNLSLRQELLGTSSAPWQADTSTISLYPYETAHDLRLILVFVALFAISASIFRTTEQIQRALVVIFAIGCLESAISVLQIMTRSTKLLWMFESKSRLVTSGTFVNYSNFSQFVNLSLGAGIALLLLRLKEDKRADQFHDGAIVRTRWDRYLPILAGIVLCAVAILLSMSRNGALSMFVAATVIGALLYYRGELSTRGWLLGMAPWCALIVLFLTSFDLVYDRLATLEDDEPFQDRYELTSATLRAWQNFPVWGAGLGTHEYVFPRYDTAVTPMIAEHADNDWAQLLEEFGLVGTVAVVAFLGVIVTEALRLMLRGRTILAMASFGLSYGFIATAMHSLSDFGQHLPAVFGLTAVTSGLIVALGRHEHRDRKRKGSSELSRPRMNRLQQGLAVGVALSVVGSLAWSLVGAFHASQGEAWANAAVTFETRIRASQTEEQMATDADYANLISAAERAVQAEPANVRHSYVLNLYRWESLSRVVDPESGQVLLHPDVVPFVERIADELTQTRQLSPTYGPPYALEGNLRYFVLNQPEGERLINLAAELSPYDALSTRVAAQLAAAGGNDDLAEPLLSRLVQLDPRSFSFAAELCLTSLNHPELAEALAGESHQFLQELARLLDLHAETEHEFAVRAEKIRERAAQNLQARVLEGTASAGDVARLAKQHFDNQDFARAIELYRQALARDYGQIGWRLALAQALADSGDPDQAILEAKKCLRLRPSLGQATRLIEKWSTLPRQPASETAKSPPRQEE